MTEETLSEMLAVFGKEEATRIEVLEQFRNDDPDEADFTLEDSGLLTTEEQASALLVMSRFGWRATHLWEYKPGQIAVWVMVIGPETEVKINRYRHAYIEPDGTINRYEEARR